MNHLTPVESKIVHHRRGPGERVAISEESDDGLCRSSKVDKLVVVDESLKPALNHMW